jgi:hypothetical protein
MQSWNECIKLFLDKIVNERLLQAPAVLMALLLQTECNSLSGDKTYFSLYRNVQNGSAVPPAFYLRGLEVSV